MAISRWLSSLFTHSAPRNARRDRQRLQRYSHTRPQSAEVLEARAMLAADLAFVNARLVDGTFADAPNPVVGEQLGVLVTWVAEDLPASTDYQIDVLVDGVPASRTLDFRSGQPGSGQVFATFVGNFATAGTHTVDVILDVQNAIAETDEVNNTGSFTFTTDSTPDLPQQFIFPLAGESGQDWVIGNYLDADPRPDVAADYRGGPFQYNGHPGVDISPANFAAIDRGIAVLAAADGIVTEVQDGNPDRASGFSDVNIPANFITIDHGNDWQARYFHVGRDSITVQVGDVVSQGDTLALMGSSGASAGLIGGPHLHFDVTHKGRLIETFLAPHQYYVDPLPYQGDAVPTVLDAVVTNYSAFGSKDPIERMSALSEFSLSESDTAAITYFFSHLNDGDTVAVRWIAPDTTVSQTDGFTQSGLRRNGTHQWVLDDQIWKTQTGTWTVEVELAGVVQATTTFDVVAGASAPEIRVRQNGELILDERTTAISFADVAAGAAAPTVDFVVENHGGSDLTLSGLELPDGFSLIGAFPNTVAADANATFTVQLDSIEVGYKLGDIRFTTNDGDETNYNFPLEGTVTGTPSAGAPVLAVNGPGAVGYAAGSAPVLLAENATVSDSGASAFNGAQLIAERVSGANPLDVLGIENVGTGSGQVGVSGDDITFSGTVVGSTASSSNGNISIAFNAAADLAAIQAVARHLTYESTELNSTAPRTVSIEFIDADGLTSGRVYREVVPRTPQLSITITETSIDENGGTSSATVTRTGGTNSDLVVSLLSGDTSEATVPTTVTILAGQSSANLTITGVDDGDIDGTQTVVITAAATEFSDASDTIDVTDDEVSTPFAVVNTNDSGPGSLRQAILDANASASPVTITFAIPAADTGFVDVDNGSGLPGEDADSDVFRISLAGNLPNITNVNGHAITLDATTQHLLTGDTNPNGPEIELDGSAVSNGHGLVIAGDDVTVRGLNVHSFSVLGILVVADNATIVGNYIGTDPTGRTAMPNGVWGVQFSGATNSTLGGPNPADRNVVSGNGGDGVQLQGSSTGVLIQNNYIGTDASGSEAVPNNGDGVDIEGASQMVTVGGAGVGNVISGNVSEGVEIDGGSTNVEVIGNRIGTDATGYSPLGNQAYGVRITESTDITLSGGNVVSGNGRSGIVIDAQHGGMSQNVTIQGNRIGTNAGGDAAIANQHSGIEAVSVENLIVGGSVDSGNLISGNLLDGVQVRGGGNQNVDISGNLIGTAANGSDAVSNGRYGVQVQNARHVTVGGPSVDKRNVISGNDQRGVFVWYSYSVSVQNNFIGTTSTGNAALSNGLEGVRVDESTDIAIDSNVVSANGAQGVFVSDFGYEPTIIEWPESVGGNGHFYVVIPQRTWTEAEAVAVSLGTHLAAVADVGENQFLVDNVLTDNSWIGLSDHQTPDFTWSSGEAVTYTNWGVNEPNGGTRENHAAISISGTWNDLPDFFARPAILEFTTAPDLNAVKAAFGDISISNNTVGLGVDGTTDLGNGSSGVRVDLSTNVNVSDNTVANSSGRGVFVFRSDDLSFTGNRIGISADGNIAAANSNHGLEIRESHDVIIGGTFAGDGNQISGNSGSGILLWDGSSDVTLFGNRVGVNAAGDESIGNGGTGIRVDGSSQITIGGTSAGAENQISGNGGSGVLIHNAASNVTVRGNQIGTDATATMALGNQIDGVQIDNAIDVTIGGTTGDAANVIAHNALRGVFLANALTARASVRGNSIHSNGQLGIDLSPDGTTPNDPLDADSGPNGLQNFPVITSVVSTSSDTTISGSLNSIANATFDLDFYLDHAASAASAEGRTLIAATSVTTDGNGDATFTLPVGTVLPQGSFITATATDANGNTSEFSAAVVTLGMLTVAITPTEIREDQIVTGTVIRPGTSGDLVVTLSSSDAGEATVPPQVTILDGSASATFSITGVDDLTVDATQKVVIDAAASGFAAGSASVDVTNINTTSSLFVTNTNDGGIGSLRQAILDANASLGPAEIIFQIPATDSGFVDRDSTSGLTGADAAPDVYVITPASALPTIDNASGHAVTIDGATQTVFSVDSNPFGPEIIISGTGAGAADGLTLNGDDIGIYNLAINDFNRTGILIRGANAVIESNYIGVDATGRLAKPNQSGISLLSASNASIGRESAGNVISGNLRSGVGIFENSDIVNVIGNLIGTDAVGTASLGNGDGVEIVGGSDLLIEGNLISGNDTDGITTRVTFLRDELLHWETAHGGNGHYYLAVPWGTWDQLNQLATEFGGYLASITSAEESAVVESASISSRFYIGLNDRAVEGQYEWTSGEPFSYEEWRAGEPNNSGDEDVVEFDTFAGGWNDIDGSSSLGGVLEFETLPDETALRSLFTDGDLTIRGNKIGTDITGNLPVGNGFTGVYVSWNSGVMVGGSLAGQGNLISGNTDDGVRVVSDGTTIEGNRIGTNADGSAAIPNGDDGVEIQGDDAVIGGTDAGAGNLISGNAEDGITLNGGVRTIVQGNRIGTNAVGTLAIANQGDGINLLPGSPLSVIGGSEAGAGNIISGNGRFGILAESDGTTIDGNFIGATADGLAALPNGEDGIVVRSAGNNVIGGSISSSGNVISGNTGSGLRISAPEQFGTRIGQTSEGHSVNRLALTSSGSAVAAVDGTAVADGDVVVWSGRLTDGTTGIFRQSFSGLEAIVDLSTAIPNGTGTFTSFDSAIAADDGFVAFIGHGTDGQTGIYRIAPDGTIVCAADLTTVVPDGSGGTFATFDLPAIVGGVVAFHASGTAGEDGIYSLLLNETLTVIADTGTVIPDRTDTFVAFDSPVAAYRFGSSFLAFSYVGHGPAGYSSSNYSLLLGASDTTFNNPSSLVSTQAVIPGFGTPDAIDSVGPQFLSLVSGSSGEQAIVDFSIEGGTVFNTSTVVPGGTGTYASLSPAFSAYSPGDSVDNLTLVFTGPDSAGVNGLYLAANDSVEELLRVGDVLDDRIISNVAIGADSLSTTSVLAIGSSNIKTINSVVARVEFTDGTVGLYAIDPRPNGTVVANNSIGVAANGEALGNGKDGIRIENASNTQVGGVTVNATNHIAFNGGNGIGITGSLATGNAIQQNSIHDNTGVGIDLGNDGVTVNDTGDTDTGPNGLQNWPVINPLFAGMSPIVGSLNSTPNSTFNIELFSNSAAVADAEGETSLGTVSVTTDNNGDATFSLPATIIAGLSYTATATDSNGNTSEFSPGISAIEDTTAPSSRALRTTTVFPTTATFPITLSGSDGVDGSGIDSFELYVSTNGSPYTLWRTVHATAAGSAGSFEATVSYTGSSLTIYRFHTRAIDSAGNREPAKVHAEALFYLRDVDAPQSQVDTVAFNANSGLFTVDFGGTDVGGQIANFELFMSVDGATPVRVGTVAALSSGTLQVEAVPGTHTYRFFTIATDNSGNVEAFPGSSDDVTVTETFTPAAVPEVVDFDVQQDANQRSFINTLDITFSTEAGLDDLIAASGSRIQLVNTGRNGNGSTIVDLSAATFVRNGRVLTIDLAPVGLQDDGIYELRLNLDNTGTGPDEYETVRTFHRLQGDSDGDGDVDMADIMKIRHALIFRSNDTDADINGDGLINILDYVFAARNFGVSLDPIGSRSGLDD